MQIGVYKECMIPLRDHNPSRTFPFVTYGLIALNVYVFFQMLMLTESGLESFINTFALLPADIVGGRNLFTLISSMFLHGGFGHIIGNMMFLHIFGDNLEDTIGHVKYFFYYILCGLGASALQIYVDPASTIPNLGASGAIAGLMGGYILLFPSHKVDVLIPLGFYFSRATIPAYLMLGYWFIAQFLSGIGSLGITEGGVAYFAHIGGFIAGIALILPFRGFLLRKSYTQIE